MIETIYIEEKILQHPRVTEIIKRFPQARTITCDRYGEVFNPKAQNFRLQKQKPALILAEKYRHFTMPAPLGYGIGASKNYYFSHMLNCLYDCRYCFLQGMYQSANYVLFVNYEDFQAEIQQRSAESPNESVHFFSGYDCDSLALEPVTGFAEHFLPIFKQIPNAWLELRTKSTQVRSLLNTEAFDRCVVGYQQQYQRLFEQVFSKINLDQLHSVSLGVFRLPESYFKKVHKLYPEERLFISPFDHQQGMVSYKKELEQEVMTYCSEQLLRYIPKSLFFPCIL